MNLPEFEAWLIERFGQEKFNPGLERISLFLAPELSQLNHNSDQKIIIAGTNGKGETSLRLAQQAKRSGLRYVLWTSPHILSITERFQNEKGEISFAELSEEMQKISQESLERKIGLSFYEALWAGFVRWGLKKNPDIWILEVGLGGRLDAVNTVHATGVALTSISRDHQEFLGPRYENILLEKLGVTRPGAWLVSALESVYLQRLTEDFCRRQGTDWTDLFTQGVLTKESAFSTRNQRLAQAVWRKLGHPVIQVEEQPLIGRGEQWETSLGHFVFYGSHNPDGMRKLVQFLCADSYNGRKEKFHQIWVAFSNRPVRDLRLMAKLLKQLAQGKSKLVFTEFTHAKAATLETWCNVDEGSSERIHEWTELFKFTQPSERILVTGSYYFVAQVQSHLLQHSTIVSRR